MKKENESFEIQDKDGYWYGFSNIDAYQHFIKTNSHLFNESPIIPTEETDYVNHPPHYADRKYEVIDVMKDGMSHEAFKGYLEGCVRKYIERHQKKGKPLQDLEKAQWYLKKLIETIKEETTCCG